MKSIKKFVVKVIKVMSVVTVFIAIMFIGYKTYEWTAVPKTVFADREVQVEVENTDIPILKRISVCESGGKHFDKSGQVLLKGNTNKTVDIGVMQINETYWGKKANELGYNLTIEKDNRAFAKWLFYNYGSGPWSASQDCWSK